MQPEDAGRVKHSFGRLSPGAVQNVFNRENLSQDRLRVAHFLEHTCGLEPELAEAAVSDLPLGTGEQFYLIAVLKRALDRSAYLASAEESLQNYCRHFPEV